MKPILFNTEMVRAILDGRKTVTRRVVKPQPKGQLVPLPDESGWPGYFGGADTPRVMRPPYFIGDILYVRETWCNANTAENPCYFYKADGDRPHDLDELTPWRPSIHMPKEAARLFLRVTGVRVEHLRVITVQGCKEEGVVNWCISPCSGFISLWDSTIKPADRALYGWEANPWVWVIEFERITKEEAEHGPAQV